MLIKLLFCIGTLASMTTFAKSFDCDKIKNGKITLEGATLEDASKAADHFFSCVAASKEFQEKVSDIAAWEGQCKISTMTPLVLESSSSGRPSFDGEIGGTAAYLYGVSVHCSDVGTGLFSGIQGSVMAKIEAIWQGIVCLEEADKTCVEKNELQLKLVKIVNNNDL